MRDTGRLSEGSMLLHVLMRDTGRFSEGPLLEMNGECVVWGWTRMAGEMGGPGADLNPIDTVYNPM
jgi:hypothetical protein